jgi:rare lipoprotein A
MARSGIGHIAVLAVAGIVLAGCEDGKNPLAGNTAEPASVAEEGTARPASSVRLVDRDVEAPEVFQVTDQGLWDGRPSLGGVWVATPDVKDPERVIIRNPANGKFVIGALFRREHDNPGPRIQISSDAAAALGMLAGQPEELNVTALRREEEPTTTPDASQPILDAAETVDTEALDTAAVAAAIDNADAAAPADVVVAEEVATVDGTAVEVIEETPAPTKKKWWQRNKKDEAEIVEVPADGAVAAEGAADLAAAATAAIAVAPLDEPAAAPAPVAAAPGKSLIQLGIFSVEANAKRAADMVIKAGSPATVRTETGKGKTFWSVVAGPANTPAEREALMAKVKGLGFKDAYFVSR